MNDPAQKATQQLKKTFMKLPQINFAEAFGAGMKDFSASWKS